MAKAAELFKTAQAVIDSVADKGIFHKNKAARHKSRLSAKIKALAAPAAGKSQTKWARRAPSILASPSKKGSHCEPFVLSRPGSRS